ncbi:cupin domain-containing protein [Phenylobacterium sp.]|uniref:cupin domain-containing protein n=1 Tax=Phenylobacterium sp. TaxID=1871053 RepID=UPI00272444CB|nr:cupin domain-containing protein [Phenylobacterium sp.]MDO8801720.1 cupin domain-containing protein [Phenylobacterium sp.]
MTAESAAALIARLDLAPHPEGGWYRETWRAPAEPGAARGPGTAILFLLEAGQTSHWHRIDATELWLFQAGTALTLKTAASDTGPITAVRLGADILAGDAPQGVVAPREWQAAQASADGWALVACVVVPGFEFAGFELAAAGWAPGA